MPIRFTVADLNFSYNTIMGQPLINKIKAIISPHQLLLQFEQDNGKVGILQRDQKATRQCLINGLKHDGAPGVFPKRKRKEEHQSVMSVYLHNLNVPERPQPL
jgi:hypothetical protein